MADAIPIRINSSETRLHVRICHYNCEYCRRKPVNSSHGLLVNVVIVKSCRHNKRTPIENNSVARDNLRIVFLENGCD